MKNRIIKLTIIFCLIWGYVACDKNREEEPQAPFTIVYKEKVITCQPDDINNFDFTVEGADAKNLTIRTNITEPWKARVIRFEPTGNGYSGTIKITAPGQMETSGKSTIDITIASPTYSSTVKIYLIANPRPPKFTITNLDTNFTIDESREILFSLYSEEHVSAFKYHHTNADWHVALDYNNPYFSKYVTSGKFNIQAPDKPSETDITLEFEGQRQYQALIITIYSQTLHLKCTGK